MQTVKEGSSWTTGSDRTVFTVLHRIEIEGHWWIHYRDNNAKEYSCYEEAFVARFREQVR